MGLSFDEWEILGKMRKIQKLGPFSMVRKLIPIWNTIDPKEIS